MVRSNGWVLVRGEIIYRENFRCLDGKSRGDRARLVWQPSKNTVEVFDLNMFGQPDPRRNSVFVVELTDPRAIPAAIRTFCRLLKQEMPSFWAVDEALKEEAPVWWHEEFDQICHL